MTKRQPLTETTILVLRHIRQECNRVVDLGKGKVPLNIWSPPHDDLTVRDEWGEKRLGDFTSGGGRVAIRSLLARGLIERADDDAISVFRRITLAGRQELVRLMGPMPKQRQIKFSQLRKWSLTCSKRMPPQVVINGIVRDWVGIGHTEVNDRPDVVTIPIVVEG